MLVCAMSAAALGVMFVLGLGKNSPGIGVASDGFGHVY